MEWEREMAMKFREGEAQARRETAIALLRKELPVETISECVKIPLEEVLELQKQITVTA